MTDRIRKTLGDLKARQDAGERMPCPRCGRDTMKENVYSNALSRHADIYICDACGTEEALLKFMHNPLPLREWACFLLTQKPSDFKMLPAEEVWKRVQDTQVSFLMKLYERWQDEHEYEDFNDYRAAAFESCPGLTALWAQPFRAEYAAADDKLVLRFRLTDEGMKKALFMYGPGDTGKSVLKALVENLLGKGNFIGIDLSDIEARFGTGSIYGKRLVGSSDMSFLTVAELKTFKKCTGGDSIFAEFKGQNSFEYTFGGMMWFCMNRLPKFGGDDGKWVYERIMQIPCLNSIPAEKQDKYLLDKLLNERAGIVYRMVMATKNVIDNGYRFTEPESVKADRQLYRNNNSTVVTFFEDCMMPIPVDDKSHRCTAMKVYSAYQAWCRDNNRGYAKTAREFKDELAAHLGITAKELMIRRSAGMIYREYTLTPETVLTYIQRSPYTSADEDFLNEQTDE